MKYSLVIIIVNYNGYDDSRACLNSILTIQGDLPLVVLIDNGSKDTADLETLKLSYSHLHIIYNIENIGFGRANNIGIKWALQNVDFEYLLLLNNDTLIEPESLHILISPFNEDHQIGITTGKIMYEYNRGLVWYGGGDIDKIKGWPKIADFNKEATSTGANLSRYVSFVSGCLMMFSKESICRLGGFDEDFFMYCEDLELSIRAQTLGLKMFYEASSVIYHKVQGSSSGSSSKGFNKKNKNLPFIFFHMQKNRWLAIRKHYSGSQFFIFNLCFCSELIYRSIIFLKWKRFDLLKTTKDIFRNTLFAKK